MLHAQYVAIQFVYRTTIYVVCNKMCSSVVIRVSLYFETTSRSPPAIEILLYIYKYIYIGLPIPVIVRSKALVSGCSLAAIAGSNPAGAWISLSCVDCVVKGAVSATGCSLVQMNPDGCGVIVERR
jgi:hypothetical protein